MPCPPHASDRSNKHVAECSGGLALVLGPPAAAPAALRLLRPFSGGQNSQGNPNHLAVQLPAAHPALPSAPPLGSLIGRQIPQAALRVPWLVHLESKPQL